MPTPYYFPSLSLLLHRSFQRNVHNNRVVTRCLKNRWAHKVVEFYELGVITFSACVEVKPYIVCSERFEAEGIISGLISDGYGNLRQRCSFFVRIAARQQADTIFSLNQYNLAALDREALVV